MGNEAVDQLKKFNQALADFSMAENPRLIDGILLTKFDTIDDKVSYEQCLYFRVVHAKLFQIVLSPCPRFLVQRLLWNINTMGP